ncbi:MAG: phosphate ABC transporter permease PstA [SAR324 cluster bacterium]|nr:phosphate ABC transporter permease PstA [SAR324 cluster bacterium]
MPSSKQDSYKDQQFKKFWREGEAFIWLSGLGVALVLFMVATLVGVIVKNGAQTFWPKALVSFTLADDSKILGELVQEQEHPHSHVNRYQIKVGNRDLNGVDFKWIIETEIKEQSVPDDAIVLERMEYGNFHGFIKSINSSAITEKTTPLEDWEKVKPLLHKLEAETEDINDEVISRANVMESIRLEILKVRYHKENPAQLERRLKALTLQFEKLMVLQAKARTALIRHTGTFVDVNGREKEMVLAHIVRSYQPNQLGLFGKLGVYISKMFELFFDEPRESNTEGGLFPAIVGTVMLILTMSIFSFPLGLIAAVYMKEYAKPGILLQAIRVAVSNLAGVPSIVWGIFGLTFFVYTIGGGIDSFFYPERLPTPTFGTGGVLWGSLTLALLTVPVVIVATEEALAGVPGDLRHGSYALGATKFQTLINVTIPMAMPRIITGFILAMSRAAGEVAPLMITGVVKLAPTLPLDGEFPFVHLERKFMHLGFHIYDVGFQSPNVEAAKPMVFVTTLVLMGIVIALSMSSIILRNKIRKKYAARAF